MYEVTLEPNLGFGEQKYVAYAVHMPRPDFLVLVEKKLNQMEAYFGREVFEDMSAKLWPVARSMDRFAMSTYLHSKRGCGCLVGEYLVAADILNRADAFAPNGLGACRLSVFEQIEAQPDSDYLTWMGSEIDNAVRAKLRENIDEQQWYRMNGSTNSSDIIVAFENFVPTEGSRPFVIPEGERWR